MAHKENEAIVMCNMFVFITHSLEISVLMCRIELLVSVTVISIFCSVIYFRINILIIVEDSISNEVMFGETTSFQKGSNFGHGVVPYIV